MKTVLTKKKVLSAFKKYIRKHGFAPRYVEIGAELGLTKGRIAQIVDELVADGKMKKENHRFRNISIIK